MKKTIVDSSKKLQPARTVVRLLKNGTGLRAGPESRHPEPSGSNSVVSWMP